MEFRDLKKQYAVLKNDIDRHIDEVIASSRFIGGSKVSELEEKLVQSTALHVQTEQMHLNSHLWLGE